MGTHSPSWGSGLTLTGLAHVEAATSSRKAFQAPQTAGEAAGRRDLADYDQAFGVLVDDGRSPDAAAK